MKIRNENMELKILSTTPDNSLTPCRNQTLHAKSTITISSLEEKFSGEIFLEDNKLYSMAENNPLDNFNLKFNLELLEIAAENKRKILLRRYD